LNFNQLESLLKKVVLESVLLTLLLFIRPNNKRLLASYSNSRNTNRGYVSNTLEMNKDQSCVKVKNINGKHEQKVKNTLQRYKGHYSPTFLTDGKEAFVKHSN